MSCEHGIVEVALARVAALEAVAEAAEELRKLVPGHTSHFDHTGQGGLGCPQCIEERKARDSLGAALAALDRGEGKTT